MASPAPQMRRPAIRIHAHRAIDGVELLEMHAAGAHRGGNGREHAGRLLDRLARVVHDAPAPLRTRRGGERDDLHGYRPSPRPAEPGASLVEMARPAMRGFW